MAGRRKSQVFERQSELPLNLTLAIDISGSVHKDRAQETVAARRFAHAIMRPQDQMNLLQFATEVQELTRFTNKVSDIDRGLDTCTETMPRRCMTPFTLARTCWARSKGARCWCWLPTAAIPPRARLTARPWKRALRNEVMIYSIIDVPIEASAGRDLGGEHALITLAEQTGGKSFYVSDGGLDKAFARVSDDLRTQYLIGYYPHNQEPGRIFHRLQVTIPRAAAESFNIRHRTGYYADSPAKSD